MNDDQITYWTAYFRFLADQLTLKDYVIVLSRETPQDHDATASVWVNKGNQSAVIYLARDWEVLGDEKQRWFAIHELLHIHFDRIDTVLDLVNRRLDNVLANFARDLARNEIEFAVDDLARAFAPFFPTPKEWHNRAKEGTNADQRHPSPSPRGTFSPSYVG